MGYYAFLHAVLVRHSMDFGSEYSAAIASGTPLYMPWLTVRNASGWLVDLFPTGAALLGSPFYLAALALHPSGEPQYGSPFVEAFTLASLFWGLAGVALSHRLAAAVTGKAGPALAATLGGVLATPMLYYALSDPSYSHTFSVFCVAAFLYTWWKGPPPTARGWALLGFVGGLMGMTRFQDGLLMAIVLVDWRCLRRPALALVPGTALGFAPQLATDRIQLGGWLPRPFPGVYIDPLHGQYVELLFSSHHGLLVWIPIAAVAAVGVFFLPDRRLKFACLVAAAVELAITGATLENGGSEFGPRRLLALLPFAIVGLAAFAVRVRPLLAWCGLAVFGGWNLLLVANFDYLMRGAVPGYRSLTLDQLSAVAYVPRLFAKGGVLRDVVRGDARGAVGILAVEAACVAAAFALAMVRASPAMSRESSPAGSGGKP